MKIDDIPMGAENAQTKAELCKKTKTDESCFREILTELKKDNIIIHKDGGYFRPDKISEVQTFMDDIDKRIESLEDLYARCMNLMLEAQLKQG